MRMSDNNIVLHFRASYRHPFETEIAFSGRRSLIHNEIVGDVVDALGGDYRCMAAVLINNISMDQRLMLIIIATDSRRQGMSLIFVQVVVTNGIPRTRRDK